MIAEQLVRELAECGYAVEIEGDACGLRETMPGAILPRGLFAQVKKHKAAILALCVCAVCGRVTTDLETMVVLGTNFTLCDRGGGKAYRDWEGIEHPAEGRCPYREKMG